jgi:hypothetical protein
MKSSTLGIVIVVFILFILLITLVILPTVFPCVTYDIYGMCIKTCGPEQKLVNGKCTCGENMILSGNVCLCKSGYSRNADGNCVQKLITPGSGGPSNPTNPSNPSNPTNPGGSFNPVYTPPANTPVPTPPFVFPEPGPDDQTSSDDALLRNEIFT